MILKYELYTAKYQLADRSLWLIYAIIVRVTNTVKSITDK